MNFIAIKEVIGTSILSSYRTFHCWKLKPRTRTRNKDLIKSQETSDFGFWSHKRSKRKRKKSFYKVSGNPHFEFYSHKPSKRIRNKCLIKAQKLAVLAFKVINDAKWSETKVLPSHSRNFPFWLFWFIKRNDIFLITLTFLY